MSLHADCLQLICETASDASCLSMFTNGCCVVNDGLAVTAYSYAPTNMHTYLVVQVMYSWHGLIMHDTSCHLPSCSWPPPMLIPSRSDACRWLDLRDCLNLVSLPMSMLHPADSSRHFCPLPAWRTVVLQVVPHQSSVCLEKKCSDGGCSSDQVLRGILALFDVVNAGRPLKSTTAGSKDPHQDLRVACHALQDMCLASDTGP